MADIRDIRRELESMVLTQLFDPKASHAGPESLEVLGQEVRQMGLGEAVEDQPGAIRATQLGKALNVDLAMVFLGMLDEWAATRVLYHHGLISENEWDLIDTMMDADGNADAVFQPIARIAYQRLHNPGGWLA